jgi:N-acetylglucosaminyldiphosphoundecaprenol N-acetyl-beta-D-mannosaminyltransferase
MAFPSPPRVNLLGVNVSAIDMAPALAAIAGWVARSEPRYVCVTPAHAIMDCYDNPALRAIYNASGLTTPDGMAVVWWLKLHRQRHVTRVYGPDLLQAVCAHLADSGARHYFYGGAPGVAEKLVARLRRQVPGLQVAGIISPPFRALTAEEDAEVRRQIAASQADIVWVGIGSPRQEMWMAEHCGQVGAPVLVGVGAAFDFLSGSKPQAPLWVQRSGLEWLFRLFSEPRRLWKRYVLGYPRFVVLAALQGAGVLKFPPETP